MVLHECFVFQARDPKALGELEGEQLETFKRIEAARKESAEACKTAFAERVNAWHERMMGSIEVLRQKGNRYGGYEIPEYVRNVQAIIDGDQKAAAKLEDQIMRIQEVLETLSQRVGKAALGSVKHYGISWALKGVLANTQMMLNDVNPKDQSLLLQNWAIVTSLLQGEENVRQLVRKPKVEQTASVAVSRPAAER